LVIQRLDPASAYLAQVALIAAAYFAVARLSLVLAIPPGYATAVWPPSGIALAAVYCLATEFWPGVWIGAALPISPSSRLPFGGVHCQRQYAGGDCGGTLIRRHVGT